MMHETQTLAQFVADTQYTELPPTLVTDCKIIILDTIAAGFMGAVQPWARMVLAVVRELDGAPLILQAFSSATCSRGRGDGVDAMVAGPAGRCTRPTRPGGLSSYQRDGRKRC
jgi:2-methylcitrate dehydratase MmgE/PrpD-like protein